MELCPCQSDLNYGARVRVFERQKKALLCLQPKHDSGQVMVIIKPVWETRIAWFYLFADAGMELQ